MERIERIKSMLEDDPNDSFLRYALAQEYLKLEAYDEAIEAFESLRATDPDYIGLYYHLAGLYADLEETDKAEDIYTRGIAKAKELEEHHALSELMNAKTNFDLGL